MEKSFKKRGISLSHHQDRHHIRNSSEIMQYNTGLERISSIPSATSEMNSVQQSVRYSSAPKPAITFTYQSQSIQRNEEKVKTVITPRNEMEVNLVTQIKNQYFKV